MSLKNKSGIYVFTFPNGKQYVGQSLDLYQRLKGYRADVKGTGKDINRPVISAIRKYGWVKTKIEYPFIIDRNKVNDVDLSIILDVLEIKYIKEYDCVSPNGYNLSLGADSTLFTPDLAGEIVGRTLDKSNHKPVLLYNKDGIFLKEYNSISDCAYQLHINENEVRKYANCRKYMRGMYIVKLKKGDIVPANVIPYSLKYKELTKTVIKEIEVIKEKPISWKQWRTQILQYDLNGNFIREWESISSAARYIGLKTIDLTAKTSGGFIWRRKESERYPLTINPIPTQTVVRRNVSLKGNYKSKYSTKIIQCDLNGDEIARFKSIVDAANATGFSYNKIYGAISGKTKNPDYIWLVAG